MTKCAARAELFWRPLRPASSSVAWFSDVRGRSRSFSLSSLRERDRERTRTSENQATFSGASFFETQVTGYEPQGTMKRVQMAGEARLARCLPPRAHFHRERDVWVTEAANRRRHLRIAVTRKASSSSPLSHVLFGKRRAICTTSVSSQIFRIGWFEATERERQLTTVRANQNNWLDQWQSGKIRN